MNWLNDLISRVLTVFPRLTLVQPDEGGVRFTPKLRGGLRIKELLPGIYLWWPLIQQIETIKIKTQVVDLRGQSLTTKDGVVILVSGAIQYWVSNAERAILNVLDYDKTIQTLALGIIAGFVNKRTYEECRTINDLEMEILKGIREAASGFGLKIMRVYITDLCKAKSFRIMGVK